MITEKMDRKIKSGQADVAQDVEVIKGEIKEVVSMLKGQAGEVIKGLEDGIKSATRGMSNRTVRLTESAIRYKDMLSWLASHPCR